MYKVKKGFISTPLIILLYYKLLYKNNSIYKGGIFTYSDK